MARPIKETPILYGEDARKFMEQMKNVRPYTDEEIEEIKRGYEFIKSRFRKQKHNEKAVS